mmetsp:Transcript_3150/g.4203  ORF Transcript_3150/g.4203 Transcript_3150/m.4203 type:complete len:292 (-) Transcript_3150:994-1869(-)
MCLKDLKGFRNLGIQGFGTLKKMKKFRVVHLKQHARNLAGQFRLRLVDKGIKTFANHVFLHFRRSRRKCGCRKGTLRWCGLCLRRRLLGRSTLHGCTTGISSGLVELDVLLTRSGGTSAWLSRGASTASATGSTTRNTAASSTALLRHTIRRHGVTSTTLLLSHNGVHTACLLLSATAAGTTRTTHHSLWHHGVCWLHGTTWPWSLHVHRHARVSHGLTHRSTHHVWLARSSCSSWTSSVRMLSLKLRTTNISALCQCHKDWLVSDELSVHFIDCPGCFFWRRKTNETKAS